VRPCVTLRGLFYVLASLQLPCIDG
jgi:hypothetical protein